MKRDPIIAICFVLILGAVTLPLLQSTQIGRAVSGTQTRLSTLHTAMVQYGLDNNVSDELPNWGPLSPLVLRYPDKAFPYLAEDKEDVMWPADHPTGWTYSYPSGSSLGSGFYFRPPTSGHRGVLFADYRDSLQEAVSREAEYAAVIDQTLDMRFYFPQERDLTRGAVLIELWVDGSTHVTRRAPIVRRLFEQRFQQRP